MNAEPGTTIDIVVIDDHMVIHDGLRAVAEREPDIRYLGGTTDGDEALDLVERMRPDVAMIDVRIGATNGLELCERVRQRAPDTLILIFSAFCNEELLVHAIRSGAAGYLLKDTDTLRLPGVLRELCRSGRYFDPKVAGDLLVGMVADGGRTDPGLTQRERQIIQMVAEGASNYEIASELNLSYHTVKFHLAGLMRRFDVRRRAELVKVAMERQLL